MVPILVNTYFSGAGLMDIGLEAGGLTLQQSFGIDAVCCDTMRQNFTHEVVHCDITRKLVLADKDCHVMVATYPCTKYSPIGDIHGVRTGAICFCISSDMLLSDDQNSMYSRMFRADAGEGVVDNLQSLEIDGDVSEEKIVALAEIICREGDEPATKSAALQ